MYIIIVIWKYYKNIRHLSFSSCIFKRDFSYFLKIIHILTSFLTLCSIVWRQKRLKPSQKLKKRIFYIGKHRNPYNGHLQVTKTRDLSNFLKIINKLTSFLTLCSVVWRQKHFKQSQEPQKRIFYIGKHRNTYIGHFSKKKSRFWSFS